MKLLYVVPYAPTRIRTRPFNLVRGLARRGHAVTLATLAENAQDVTALDELAKGGIQIIAARLTKTRAIWNSLRALPTTTPLQAVYCWQPELAEGIQSAVTRDSYDIIHVEHLRGARYGLSLNVRIPIVWDSVDCISYLFEQAARSSRSPFGRIVTRLELGRTRRYEGQLVNQFARVLVTSPVDAAALQSLTANPTPIAVLPNGVDLEYFSSGMAPREPDTVVFTGKMSYHANVTAALHLLHSIMPLVWKERPQVRVLIVGKDPPGQLRKLAVDQPSRVTVTGTVPDMRPYLRQNTLAVAPIGYGAGIQNKVLEAMACATPIVASPQAVCALTVHDGEQLLIGDSAEVFAAQVVRLLQDAELRNRIGTAGRRYVEQYHDWSRIVERLEDIYRQAIPSDSMPTHHAA